jgi:hypothetical protein
MHAVRASPAVRRRRPPRRLLPRRIALVEPTAPMPRPCTAHRHPAEQASVDVVLFPPRVVTKGSVRPQRSISSAIADFSDQFHPDETAEPTPGPYLILSSRHSWAMAQQWQQQCTIRSSHGSTCGTTRPVGRCGANHTFNTQQDCRKMRGATRSKAAHLQVVLGTDLTAVLRGDEADDARAVGLQAEMRAARAEVAAGHASICLPHDRKGQELRRGLAQPLGYPCPETPCLPSSSRRASRRHRGCSKSCRDLCRGE